MPGTPEGVPGTVSLQTRPEAGATSVERVAAGAGAAGVRVVDREALLLDGVDEVDRRAAEVPNKRIARQVWEVLVFMIWHGIFVEERIHPQIPEPVYPVRL